MKRVLNTLLFTILAVCLTACGENPVASDAQSDVVADGIAQYTGSKARHMGMMDRALGDPSVAGKDEAELRLIFAINKQRVLERYSVLERYRVLERYAMLERYAVLERYEYQHAFDGYAITIQDLNGLEDFSDFMDALEADDEILWFEPDFQVSTPEASTGSDPSGQMIPWNVAAVGARESWAASGDGAGSVDVDVYVLDSGVTNSDLNVVASYDFRDSALVGDPEDVDGHGTHVAGTIAAIDDADGLVGIAPGARIHNLKVLGDDGKTDVSVVVAAVEHIIEEKLASPSTPMVVNMSIGEDIGTESYTALDEAVRVASNLGVTFVVSAGNAGKNASKFTPAHVSEVITVGAYDVNGEFASYSNHGPKVDLLAPGSGVVSLAPGTDKPVQMSGTSMAAAHVAGAAALHLALNPNDTPAAVQAALLANAKSFVLGNPSSTTNRSVWVGSQDTRLRVNLTDSQGQPLAGLRVDLLRENGSYSGTRLYTDDAGSVGFEVDQGLLYGVAIYHSGGRYDVGGLRSGDVEVIQTVTSTLTLTDGFGSPISGQRVDLLRENGSYAGKRLYTDDSGQTTFQILPGFRHAFNVYHSGGAFKTEVGEDNHAANVQTLTSSLTLTDSFGAPVSGQRVDLLRENGSYAGKRLYTDDSGQTTFQILPGFRHAFNVYHSGGAFKTEVGDDNHAAAVQTVTSTLTLTDSFGAPISGQRVDLLRENGSYAGTRVYTDDAGQSTFQILPGFRHAFNVYHSGGAFKTEVGDDNHAATVQTVASSLTLTDSFGAPISGQRVDLLRENGSYAGTRVYTDDSGQSTFQILPGFRHAYNVYHSGGVFKTEVGEDNHAATVQTMASTLTLIDPLGAALSGQRVDLLRENGSYAGTRVYTNDSGQSTFQVLPGFRHLFRVYTNGLTFDSALLTGSDDATVTAL